MDIFWTAGVNTIYKAYFLNAAWTENGKQFSMEKLIEVK